MPRVNPFFNNLSETPIINERDAIDCLEEYCNENGISIYSLPNGVINDFIETVRYAPHEIQTSEIARRVGIHGVERRLSNGLYYTVNDYMAHADNTEQTRPQAPRRVMAQRPSRDVGVSLQGLHSNNRPLSSQLTNDNSIVRMNSIENVEEISNEQLRDYVSTLDFVDLTASYPPKKKKKRKRSEQDMMMEIVRSDNFPRPNFKDFTTNREIDSIVSDWCSNVDYREQWIFSRREREGFNRRNVGFFSLDDVMSRMSKRRKPHELDSQFSKFYDWKLGGTDWILRLELYQHEQYYFLITRHIHVPTDTEIKFDVRYWQTDKFKPVNAVWCQVKNNTETFERVFGSNDENSPYFVPPYEEDEADYDEYYNSDEYEDSPF